MAIRACRRTSAVYRIGPAVRNLAMRNVPSGTHLECGEPDDLDHVQALGEGHPLVRRVEVPAQGTEQDRRDPGGLHEGRVPPGIQPDALERPPGNPLGGPAGGGQERLVPDSP